MRRSCWARWAPPSACECSRLKFTGAGGEWPSPLDCRGGPPPACALASSHRRRPCPAPSAPFAPTRSWVAGDALGISAVTTAMMGLCVLLSTGVLQWKECLSYPAAWDTLFWFAGARRCVGTACLGIACWYRVPVRWRLAGRSAKS